MNHASEAVRILCVDDEPQVLEGLSLHLRRHFQVSTATSGTAALDLLADAEALPAVIVSDMRMPGMDGATFFSRARERAPNAIRILLTGHSDINSAIAAINDGQIFRFLTKPCPPAQLLASINAAVEQHRLVTAQKVLLEETLRGSIKALTDILALANPTSFGRALRIKHHVKDIAAHLGLMQTWPVEVAAMFSQVGMITLPPETVEKLVDGSHLTVDEEQMVARMPALAQQLLSNIPRMEVVREIIAESRRDFRAADATASAEQALIRRSAHALRLALDFDALDARGLAVRDAFGALRARRAAYDPNLLDAFEEIRSAGAAHTEVREIKAAAARPGMVLAEDVRLTSGTLLASRGYEITERFVQRLTNFARGSVREPLRVVLPRNTAAVPRV